VWGFSGALVSRIERAREEGVEVFADQYPSEASQTGLDAALLPRWAQVGGRDSLLARFANAATGARIRTEMIENLDRRGGAQRIQIARHPADPSVEGKTLEQIARERGLDAIAAATGLIRASDTRIVSFNMTEGDIATLMRQPWMMTGSDGTLVPMGEGVPHPRAYGTYPRKLRRYVMEEGVVDLGMAIRSMTALPAAVFRMRDRGQIRPGAVADIVVFDLARVRDRATYSEPHQLAEGMVHVLVNGKLAMDSERLTNARSGAVLSRSDK
jgi:N-acyl-D-aspartate/D-glutamate deacylase